MTTQEGMPADWYQDPAKIGELRYYDGTEWTEHVTIDGVQTTVPFEAPAPPAQPAEPTEPEPDAPVDTASAQSFTVTRTAQRRSEEERALDVVGPAGVLGRFVTLLDGAPGYRFEDANGNTVFSVSKPGLKNLVEIADPAGQRIGSISKIGRLHSRYDIARADTGQIATAKLAPGAIDEWSVQFGNGTAATVTRTSTSPADSLDLASVQYAVAVSAPIDDHVQRLLLAVPIAIDVLDTQAL